MENVVIHSGLSVTFDKIIHTHEYCLHGHELPPLRIAA